MCPRFEWNNQTIAIEDNKERKHYYTDITCIDELIALMNRLHEENESLKQEKKFLKNKIRTYKRGNAILKQALDEYRELMDERAVY